MDRGDYSPGCHKKSDMSEQLRLSLSHQIKRAAVQQHTPEGKALEETTSGLKVSSGGLWGAWAAPGWSPPLPPFPPLT